MLSLNSLRQLRRPDRSSSKFHDQLKDVLCGEEYKQWVQSLDGEDLMWLVDYLDKVPRTHSFATDRSSQHRLLIALILPVLASPHVYTNSDNYVVPR